MRYKTAAAAAIVAVFCVLPIRTASAVSGVVIDHVGCDGVEVSVPIGMTADVDVSHCAVKGITVGRLAAGPANVCGPATYSADIALGYDFLGGFLTAAEAPDFNHYTWICNSETITTGYSTGGCYANLGAATTIERCTNTWIGGNFSPPSYIVSDQSGFVTNYAPINPAVGSSSEGTIQVNFAVDAYESWTLNAYCYAPSTPGNGWIGYTDLHCQIH
jgi:hypothetical protein